MDVEKVLPLFLRKKLVTMTETVYPNRERYRSIWTFWHQTLATPAQVINDALYPAKVGRFVCLFMCLFICLCLSEINDASIRSPPQFITYDCEDGRRVRTK